MRRITFRDRLRYRFDNTMSRGPIPLIGWLFLLSAILILAVSLLVRSTGVDPEGRGFLQIVWASLMRTLDAGTMGGDTGNWPFLLSMFAVTLGGVFLVSILIGILTTGIEAKLDDLRKGRSFVAETGHTVILGWSPQILTILSELMVANENQGRQCIAILADKDKVEMEAEVRSRVEARGRTRVVCRTGNPFERADLAIVNPDGARSIVVLPGEAQGPDAFVIKVVLAIINNPGRRSEPYHIVAAVRDRLTLEAVHRIMGNEVQLVLAGDLIARIAAQTSRQSGLSVVYTELLDFGGDEIYVNEEPGLVGRTFGEALFLYEDSALIGLRFRDGRIQLNPPMDTRIESGDKVIAISRDDDTVRLSGLSEYAIDDGAVRAPDVQESDGLRVPLPERTLILGWNGRAPTLIAELDHYVAPASELTILAQQVEGCPSPREMDTQSLHHLTVTSHTGDTTDRRLLDRLDIPSYHHVLVLSYCDALDAQRADALTLLTLLHLRDIADRHGHPFSLVSEMLDVRNRDLAEAAHADDFIVSDKLISLMLAQLAENPELEAVFQDLFDPEGSELYLKPAAQYVELGRPVNFYTVVEAARRRGEVAVGYRCSAAAHDSGDSYGIRVNPKKSDPVTFEDEDRVIVLAEQ